MKVSCGLDSFNSRSSLKKRNIFPLSATQYNNPAWWDFQNNNNRRKLQQLWQLTVCRTHIYFHKNRILLLLLYQNDNNSTQYKNLNFTYNLQLIYFVAFYLKKKNILRFITNTYGNIQRFVSLLVTEFLFLLFRTHTVCGRF